MRLLKMKVKKYCVFQLSYFAKKTFLLYCRQTIIVFIDHLARCKIFMSKSPITFSIIKKDESKTYPLMRAGIIETPHGKIETPAFVSVGTKSTVKGLTADMIRDTGAQVVLANTYHLYLQPGHELVKEAGGLGKFMNWQGPTMTDSGGFQAFSLGAALGKNITKFIKNAGGEGTLTAITETRKKTYGDVPEEAFRPAEIDANGVMFRSIIDGSAHYFTPEKSIEIQHALGADIIVAFDECTSPHEPLRYQQEALDRTHRWAKRSLEYHHAHPEQATKQALFAVVQGGRHEELRKESASVLMNMKIEKSVTNFKNENAPDATNTNDEVQTVGFDGYAIGGSFAKEDMSTAVAWVNELLPEDKPRHLLGIGDPLDLFMAIEKGCDTFDCVIPTRNGRSGTIFTSQGKINIPNAEFRTDMREIDEEFSCPALRGYTRAYLSHLFHAKEMLGPMLASVHNLYFLIELTKRIRQSIIDGKYEEYKTQFIAKYTKGKGVEVEL